MSTPILATKLYIPPTRSKIVPRSRLIERLNNGLDNGSKLTLISAPAGFGKTTLVSDWVAEGTRPAAWLSLDEADSDITRFLVYLISAIQTISPTIGVGVLDTLLSPQPPATELVLSALINEITIIPEIFIFVLDDYHTIDSKPVDMAISYLIEHQPEQIHLVIVTREDPDLPLARMRARGQLTELRATDLRFTPIEAAEFLNRMMNLNLTVEDITALDKRTEGWIAGLQLAAVSLQGNPDIGGFIKSFTGSHRFVMDYLLEEVLHRQTDEIQTFLLNTSILDRLSGSLCAKVMGLSEPSGQEILEYLDRANLFIVPLDSERHWFRYHHLFSDLLLQRLQRSITLSSQAESTAIAELHKRASHWYEQNGYPADAISHSLAAKDFERAATLVELTAPAMRRNRQGATIAELAWLKALPENLIQSRPVLSVAYAYALFGGGESEAADFWLRKAEYWLDPLTGKDERSDSQTREMVVIDEKEFQRLPGMIALLRTAQALAVGDMDTTVKYARRVLEIAPKDDYLMLGGAASTLGLAAWANGDIDTAIRMISDGMKNVHHAGYISPAIGDALTLADLQLVQGHLNEAMATYQLGLQWATETGMPIMRGTADMHVGMGNLYCERNDIPTALQHLQISKDLGELAGLPQNPYRWCAVMANVREAQGDISGALDFLDQAERVYNGNFSPNVCPITTRKVRLWLAQDRLDDALKWVNEQNLTSNNDLSYLREFDHITLVRVLLARYQCNQDNRFLIEAIKLLDRLLIAAMDAHRYGSVIEILVLKAKAYLAQGNQSDALMSLQEALSLAEPQGYARLFLREGPEVIKVIRQANEQGILPDYTGELLAAFESAKSIREHKSNSPIVQTLIEPLSFREMEVLKLLRSNLSGPEIAQQLNVSINTFRTHTKNIFIKLDVNDRRSAIQRAVELKIV